MRFILRLIINAGVILLVAYLIPGIHVSSFWSALFLAVVLGLINALIRPIIILLTLPINLLTLGLLTLVINALMLWMASVFVIGVEITSFATAFWGALLIWIISWFSNYFMKDHNN